MAPAASRYPSEALDTFPVPSTAIRLVARRRPGADGGGRRSFRMANQIPLAVRVRDALHCVTAGDTQRWVRVHELERALDRKIDAAVQAAVREAADAGWIRTAGGREILSVSITDEGIRVCRHVPLRRRPRLPHPARN